MIGLEQVQWSRDDVLAMQAAERAACERIVAEDRCPAGVRRTDCEAVRVEMRPRGVWERLRCWVSGRR